MAYIFNIILCVSIIYIFIFFTINFAEVIAEAIDFELLKHVKLIVFENYNECKIKHLFLIKM